ncbi:DUF58 domain-containing protein [Pacificimonas sp. WHA3]|uniref:DUF58 domain-containing protein n=1 Tax=Pacificimonas pallii TaxID=2827236 RepID=A0ABS6SF97_9SPHN|nr:DUF58 domain-containing protein [Pacificimonas pallii]MBV7257082.1 DUF58 domain-containing protein [Pacificimonas pallii]
MTALLTEAERLAAALGPLSLSHVHRRIMAEGGQHPRRRAGSGTEFWQYRPLAPGEARGRVDWRRSARSDDLFVREREREEPGRLLLFADGSGSMRFRSSEALAEKGEAATLLLTALAMAARQGDEHVRVAGRPDARALPDLHAALLTSVFSVPETGALRAGDTIIWASDFLDSDDLATVTALARRGVTGVMLHIADPVEADFPFSGHVRFTRAEIGDPEADIGRAEALSDTYAKAWQEHQDRLGTMAADNGWALIRHRTDADPAVTLSAIARHLMSEAG